MSAKRRFKLGSEIIDLTTTPPTLKFTADRKKMILTFPISSTEPPESEPDENDNLQRYEWRDMFEISGGDAYATALTASLVSVGKEQSVLTMSMRVNTKVPGTGPASASFRQNGNDGAKA